jgi:hypothetical protein
MFATETTECSLIRISSNAVGWLQTEGKDVEPKSCISVTDQ